MIDIINGQNQLKYQIDRTFCETAFLCKKSCYGDIASVDFPLLAVDPMNPSYRVADGIIVRKGRDLLTTFIQSDADTFDVVFPKFASPQEKLLIISAVLMLDFRYFEESGKRDDSKRNLNIMI